MRILIILLLGLLLNSSQAQERVDVSKWVAPYSFPVPESWGTELIGFPINFAPSIPYKGIEEIRFTPGWANKSSEEYWSYVFLWYLDGKQKIDAKTIEDHLKVYYEGLPASAKSVPRDKLIDAKVTCITVKQCNDGGAYYEGTILMLDYMSKQPLTLNYKVFNKICPGEDKTILFFKLSPQSFDHKVWKSLDKVVNDFKCNK